MMTKEDGRWFVSCDNCNETLDTETADRQEAEQVAVDQGWVIHINGNDYCDHCAERDEENDQK